MKTTAYCIGNPLVDYITDVDDELLVELELNKGQFHLATREKAEAVLEMVKSHRFKIIPGGAAANTACGITRMGGSAFFNGGVGDDDFGRIFGNALTEPGVYAGLEIYPDSTGFVVALVTPDAERTFVVYLGASLLLDKKALDFNMLRNATFLYFTGYQFESEGLRRVITAAAEFSKRTLTQVVMDLADPGLVERNRDGLKDFICEYVDILVANETEGEAYCGSEEEECVKALGAETEYAILKLGAEGSLIKHNEAIVPIEPVAAKAVDTTGAGDIYAAGIMVGLDRGYSLQYTGKIGSYAASLVIARKGARLEHDIAREIEDL